MIDIEKYVEEVAKLKGLGEEEKTKLRSVLEDTFKMRYNAVCIDIDGTLVDEKLASEGTLEILYKLLNKNVPIVFTTGRGESSTREFVNELLSNLKEQYSIEDLKLNQISCVCNNGAILLYTSGETGECLDVVKLLANPEYVKELTFLSEPMVKIISEKFGDKVIVIPSYSESLERITNVRFRIKDKTVEEQLLEELAAVIRSYSPTMKDIYKASMGHYEGDKVYQIGVTDNSESIRQAEYILGIPENSMVRICDEGAHRGNDYEILNVSQAFSTGAISDEPYACFPIIDEQGKKLEGIQGTVYLLEQLKITPTICLEKADYERQRRQLAIAEKHIVENRTQILQEGNAKYAYLFEVPNGIYDVYDKNTGGVKFADYEWELIDDNNPFKEIFEQNQGGKYSHKLQNNNSVILRGADEYYYFLANSTTKDGLSNEDVSQWHTNYLDLMEQFTQALKQELPNSSVNRRFKLAIMDNIRNLSLIMLNATMVNEFNGTNVHILFDTYRKNEDINKWVEICENVSRIMESLDTSIDISGQDEQMLQVLGDIKGIYSKSVNGILTKDNAKLNGKCFRTYREIDCYGENRLTMQYAIDTIKKRNPNLSSKDVSFNGMMYGGLELPFIAKGILENQTNIILGAVMHGGNYSQRHSKPIKEFSDERFTILGDRRSLDGHNIVSDDNVLTGKTLQIALNGLFNNGINVDDIIAVRYPSMNRVAHMFNNDHGAIDTTKFFTYINGLLFPSPYTKVGYDVREQVDAKKGAPYKDEFGIFDIRKRRVCEFLYKNGKFKKGSKVTKELGVESINYD